MSVSTAMPHIPLPDRPGIRALFGVSPETAKPLCELAETLLGPTSQTLPGSTLSRGERELIAAFVSSRNACRYCTGSHSAYAAAQLPGGHAAVDAVKNDILTAELTPKLRALLSIADYVYDSGASVTADAVAMARTSGASDRDIHDTVLIAAAFCMFNRYVDGLATIPLKDETGYDAMAEHIVEHGYADLK
ncbi:MAG TPA: peroxidase-related enzyme [Kofleriaceae bacterium]